MRFVATGQPGYLGLDDQDGLSLPFRIDAPIGTEKPIPEIVDYRKIAIGMPVVEKMELLLSPEPGKSLGIEPRKQNLRDAALDDKIVRRAMVPRAKG